MNDYKNKSASKGRSENRNDIDKLGDMIGDIIHETVVVWGMGVAHALKLIYRSPIKASVGLVVVLSALIFLVYFDYHLLFLYRLDPKTFSYSRLEWLAKFSRYYHFAVIVSLLSSVLFIWFGFSLRFFRTKYEKLFNSVGLVNRLGDTPVLLKKIKLERGKTKLIFDARHIALSTFEAKQGELEAAFGQGIEKIEHGDNQSKVAVTLTKRKLPEVILYEEAQKEKKLAPYSFYLGSSSSGVESQSIVDLPHALIAGTTGSGKSVFFKGVLMGLLESSPHLAMYLVDLKGGLEFTDFKEAPNVKVVKTIDDACSILRKIQAEMDRRFKFLEDKGYKKIDPKRDKKDRIIVAIDEASVLYMERAKQNPDHEKALEARAITDSIAKLSRAAGIHLVLATQKVTQATIDTNIQENISARMCFKTNTLQGSLIVLGNKDAMDLPDTKGRGIWYLGNKRTVMQAPYVSETLIREAAERVKMDFEDKKKSLFAPLLGESAQAKKEANSVDQATTDANEKPKEEKASQEKKENSTSKNKEPSEAEKSENVTDEIDSALT